MHDVVIVGGGPTGLFLACELALAGVRPLVLERRAEPDQSDKAHGLIGQSVRLLDQRGLYERCGGSGAPRPAPRFGYAGLPLPLDILGEANPVYTLPINQRDLERVFAERATELGVEVRRGWEVDSFTQNETRVEVLVTAPDGTSATLTAQYLVGCDGGGSRIRKGLNIEFPGVTDAVVDRSALIAPSDHLKFLPGGKVAVAGLGDIPVGMYRTEHGMFILLPHNPERPHVFTTEWEPHPVGNYPGPGPEMTLTEMEDSIERVLGVRVPLSPPPEGAPTQLRRLCNRNSRQAARYREGRVFLAGDAAHTSHGPTLNAALNDAANLGWKLAAAVHNRAPEGLLDTYETERHPAAAELLIHTRAETALTAPGAEITALRALFTELLAHQPTVATLAAGMAGSGTRYDMGQDDPSDLVGYFAPPLDLIDGDGNTRRLAEFLHESRPVLVDFTGDHTLAAFADSLSDAVRHVSVTAAHPVAPALLIRPDGYVAWAGSDTEGLQAALTRWFGISACLAAAGRQRDGAAAAR
ncbi:FAD-dependent oxidoreductase [Nocardia sp. NPDC056000]|uniref:FAD-dependent oxidoreductase n=1 Tax=Nocardia sp. NPDC056000 TaxID=3345674 RepID=UPI0035DAFD94